MLFAITRRKLKKAIAVARENGYIPSRLSDAAAATMTFYGTPVLYWPAVGARGQAMVANIRTRFDSTIYVGYAEPFEKISALQPFEPR